MLMLIVLIVSAAPVLLEHTPFPMYALPISHVGSRR